ncbi:MAG: EamA family transporter [Melioribacteraceae bacterium]|nr:EamA family transporter [Melioribacteraceae bacterium]MDD3558537.1 EamA family transporter [Melioribacteraceae bacterium]
MNKLAPTAVIIAASLWGIDGIILRPFLYNLPVSLVVFVESTIITIILTPLFYKQIPVIKNLNKRDLLAFAGVAFFGGALGTMAITKALFFVNFVNLSIVVLIQKLQPVFAISLAAIFLKEKLSKKFYIWAGLSIGGAYLLTFGTKFPNLETGDTTAEAAFYALIAALSFAASTVLSKRALRNVSFQLGTYTRFLVSAVIMLVIVISFGQIGHIEDITFEQLMIFLLIALTTGGLALFLYYYGLKRIDASTATICELAFPFTAVILEYLVHDNILDIVQWIGAAILLYSIVRVTKISTRKNLKKSVPL